jgi:thiosulfate dehydrogenase [quinone] large subunit
MLARYRSLVTPLAVVAAIVLVYMENPWFAPAPGSALLGIATLVFWILAIVVVLLMFQDRKSPSAQTVEVEGPAFVRYLFSNTKAGLFWLPIRIFLGFEWLTAGLDKLTGTGWMDGGASLLGFWTKAAAPATATAKAPISFEWYRGFLQLLIDNHAASWFAVLITFGEIAVGLGLLLGALTGVAAFFGALMNMSFLLAGSASVNPVLFTFAVGLMLAWKVAGYYGIDRYLLPRLGVPWRSQIETGSRPSTGAQPATGVRPAT